MKRKYLTFPIRILGVDPADIKTRLADSISYCLYEKTINTFGSVEDRIKQAAEGLGIKYDPSKKEHYLKTYEGGEIIYQSIPENSPKTSIGLDVVTDFYKYEKTDFEIACFLAFAAIKSILQRQPYSKITNEYLAGRMAGNSKPGEPLNDFVFRFNNRYQLDKIKSELQRSWGLKMYCGKMRGFYVSFSLSHEQLIYYAETKRKKYRDELMKSKINEAKQRALSSIYNKKDQQL
jgi:hypothetical protein